MDLEISLVKAFGWSLRDIDETDIASLLPFVKRFTETAGTSSTPAAVSNMAYCDQVSWL